MNEIELIDRSISFTFVPLRFRDFYPISNSPSPPKEIRFFLFLFFSPCTRIYLSCCECVRVSYYLFLSVEVIYSFHDVIERTMVRSNVLIKASFFMLPFLIPFLLNFFFIYLLRLLCGLFKRTILIRRCLLLRSPDYIL